MEHFDIIKKYEPKIAEYTEILKSITEKSKLEVNSLAQKVESTLQELKKDKESTEVQSDTDKKSKLLQIETYLTDIKNWINSTPEDEITITPNTERTSDPESNQTITSNEAQKEAKKLREAWHTETYIFIKMLAYGYVPKSKIIPLQTIGYQRQKIIQNLWFAISKNKAEILKAQKTFNKTKTSEMSKLRDEELKLYSNMETDIKYWINKEKFIEKYGKKLNTLDGKIKFKKLNKEQMTQKLTETFETRMEKIDKAEAEIKQLNKNLQKEMTDLDNNTKFDSKNQSKNQKKANKLQETYKKRVLELEKEVWINLSKLTSQQLEQIQKSSPLVNEIIKNNWWKVDSFLKKAWNKWKGVLLLGSSLLTLVSRGATWELSRENVWKEAGDLWVWLIPVAGWFYDAVTAFTGSPITGQEYNWSDKRIRFWVGVWTGVLDIFSFWLAGTAIRWVVKWWTKIATTASKTVKVTKWLKTWMNIAVYSYLWYTLASEWAKIAVSLYDYQKEVRTPDIKLEI